MVGTIIAGNGVPPMGGAPSQAYADAQDEMPF